MIWVVTFFGGLLLLIFWLLFRKLLKEDPPTYSDIDVRDSIKLAPRKDKE